MFDKKRQIFSSMKSLAFKSLRTISNFVLLISFDFFHFWSGGPPTLVILCCFGFDSRWWRSHWYFTLKISRFSLYNSERFRLVLESSIFWTLLYFIWFGIWSNFKSSWRKGWAYPWSRYLRVDRSARLRSDRRSARLQYDRRSARLRADSALNLHISRRLL